MAFISRSNLSQYRSQAKSGTRQLSESNHGQKVFLSHSHHDRELVEGVQGWLTSLGLNVYVDWMDNSMPSVTSPETAQKLRGKIKNCSHFILLATENSKNSKWVPWELGCADGLKDKSKIVILTVNEDHRDFTGNEYLDIYPQIKKGDNGPGVFAPKQDSGVTIKGWLENLSPY